MRDFIVAFAKGDWLGIPHVYWLGALALVTLEWALGKSSNPRLRSVASIVSLSLQKLLQVAMFGRIPIVGPVVVGLLGALSNQQQAPAEVPEDQKKT